MKYVIRDHHEDDHIMTIGDRIRYYRKVRDITQARLAEITRIHPVSIRKYETNKMTPKPEHVAVLASALNVNYTALSGYNPSHCRLDTIGDLLGFLMMLHKSKLLVMEGERDENHMLKLDTIRFYPNENLVRVFYPTWMPGEYMYDSRPFYFKFRFEYIASRFIEKFLLWESIYDRYCNFYPDESNPEDMKKRRAIITRLEELEAELQQSIKPIMADQKDFYIEDYIYGDNSIRDPFGEIKEPEDSEDGEE